MPQTLHPRIKDFIDAVKDIAATRPKYAYGHDGSDGQCDCIGLVRGALRKCRISFTGLSGTNYAARFSTLSFQRIKNISQLSPGDVVYKARSKSDPKYSLPARYREGGSSCTGDLLDYFHIGIVTCTNPLRITHMTTPTAKTDTSIGKWAYFGKLKALESCYEAETGPSAQVSGAPRASSAGTAGTSGTTSGSSSAASAPFLCSVTVTSPNGKPVKLRQSSKLSSRLYAVWDEIPIGTVGILLDHGDKWSRCQFGRKKGYMKSEFLTTT